MLQLKDICITLIKDQRNIIEGFSYSLQPKDKVAIIGEEGNGKSTLLKLMYDENLVSDYVNYSGSIIKNGKFGYLPQFMALDEQEMTLEEYFRDVDVYGNYEYVNELNLEYDFFFSKQFIKTLSGGEKVKIQLLKLLCENPDALFLDEPSNDLDIDTLTFLETFITNCSVPIVFISHDETLIENSANTIIHIEQLVRKTKCKITVSRLDYQEYLESRNMLFDKQTQVALKERSEYKKKQDRLRQLYEKARHNSSWKSPDGIASSDGHAKKSMKSLIAKGKRFERESEDFTDIPDREEGIFTKFDEKITMPSSKRVLELSLKELKIGEQRLSENIELVVTGNQHIAIIGNNGIGKSTLLKEIWRQLKDRKDLIVGYMPQNYRDVLDFNQTPSEYFRSNYDKEENTRALTYMGAMKFTSDEMFHSIGELSGGQRAKLIFLDIILRKCNVLILDEPKEALNKVSEFFGVKKKLEKIRDKVREGIVETDITLARIDGFTEGVHVANQQIANSFRVLAGKDQKDYSQEIFKADNSMLRKPWAWQKRVYQNLELHLDAAIDKVENLSLDVRNQNYEEIKKIADRDEKKVAAEKAKDQMDSYTTSVITPIMGVAEGEHKYGADAFEEFMANQGDKDKGKAPVDVAPVKKDEKRR